MKALLVRAITGTTHACRRTGVVMRFGASLHDRSGVLGGGGGGGGGEDYNGMSLPLAIMPKTLVFTAFLLFVQHTVQGCGARHDKHPCTTYCARMWSRTSCHKHLCFWRASPKQRFRLFAQHTVHVVLCFCVKRPQQKKHTKPSKATS